MIPTLPIHPTALRVFRGLKLPQMEDAAFLENLGNAFMPGTPRLLQEYGLAGYLPAVLPRVEGVQGLPDEVAIIAYSSREKYQEVRNETVVGRMYTYTHFAVFDMQNSRSQEPAPLGSATGDIRAFYLFGVPCDWQEDVDVVFWTGHLPVGADAAAFPDRFVGELSAAAGGMRELGVRECVGQVAATWAALWLVMDRRTEGEVPSQVQRLLHESLPSATPLMLQRVTRLKWDKADPPQPIVTRGSSYSFIFTREAKHFLR
jgi:hypothetical protein